MLAFGIKYSEVSFENQKEMFAGENLENAWMDFFFHIMPCEAGTGG